MRGLVGLIRIAQIEHDLRLGSFKFSQVYLFYLELLYPIINIPAIPFGARDGDLLPGGDDSGGIPGTDYGWYPQFTGDNGGMAGTSTAVGDDGRGDLHHRLPVGVGYVGDENLTRL